MVRCFLLAILLFVFQSAHAAEVVDVSRDVRFEHAVAKASMRDPRAFQYSGVYLSQAVEQGKEVVLFVHGAEGSPRDWADVASKLDFTRQQAWFAYYPSGDSVAVSGSRIAADVLQLMRDNGLARIQVIAHSMGGLVAFHIVKELETQVKVEQFVTVATPWNGHWGARFGVMLSPHPADSWRDLIPNGPSLKAIWANPLRTPYTLVFTESDDSGRATSDGVIALSSQLQSQMQAQATRVVKVIATHVAVLHGDNAGRIAALILPASSL
jgi:pimeloyl-ACP methyl ester carboxylesterase